MKINEINKKIIEEYRKQNCAKKKIPLDEFIIICKNVWFNVCINCDSYKNKKCKPKIGKYLCCKN